MAHSGVAVSVEASRRETSSIKASKVIGASPAEVTAAYRCLRAGYEGERFPSYDVRRQLLDRLLEVTLKYKEEVAEAASADWGYRCRIDSMLGDVFPTVSSIRYARSHLRSWMKPSRRSTSIVFRPGHNRVMYQPLGVVGIVAPWNYPFQLCMEPLVFAIAAGNRAIIKPSEFTPRTGELVKKMLAEVCDESWVSVVTGGADTAQAFTALPLDHILFTGSTRVGKMVMKAAAENLTPVTLELGGKSPVLVHPDYSTQKVAARLVAGKFFNSGQTCIAPDYLLVQRERMQEMVDALKAEIAARFPTIFDNPDYSSIVNSDHYGRIQGLVNSAVDGGATCIEVKADGEARPAGSNKMPPTLLTHVTDDMAVMQEEIFGPVLPIVAYDTLEDGIAYINKRPRPLAFYYFDGDSARAQQVLRSTISGSACVNECLLQYAQDDIPFGGVGASGMGAYHGPEGFETFSHKRGVFHQSKINFMSAQAPPYGSRMEQLLKFLIGK